MEDAHGTAGQPHATEGHATSVWPLVVAVGVGLTLGALITWFPFIVVGLIVFGAGVGGWLYQDARGIRFGHEGPTEPGLFRLVSRRKLGMWVFIGSEIMFFSAIIGTSLALRFRSPEWPVPGSTSPLNINLTAVNTFMLITSSFTMVQALKGVQHGNLRLFRGALLATLLLGIAFVSIQVYEYDRLLFVEHLTPWINPTYLPDKAYLGTFGTAFYMQTGFHGAHVAAGLFGLGYLNVKAWRRKDWFTPQNHEAVELVGLYWHFVDIVWIFLFPLVYLI